MADLNKVQLIGRLGKEPDIRAMQDGKEVATFSLATSEKWKDKNSGEKKEKTEWHKVVIFTPGLVEVVKKYVNKGSQLYIEGALSTRKWTNKEGQDVWSTEIVLKGFGGTLQLLGGKSSNQRPENNDYSNAVDSEDTKPSGENSAVLDDEIPF